MHSNTLPSGIQTLPTPDASRVIPQSRRPDGSLRPARRVKEGYIPPEDIQRYSIRRLASTRSPDGPVPGASPLLRTMTSPARSMMPQIAGPSPFDDVPRATRPRAAATTSPFDDDVKPVRVMGSTVSSTEPSTPKYRAPRGEKVPYNPSSASRSTTIPVSKWTTAPISKSTISPVDPTPGAIATPPKEDAPPVNPIDPAKRKRALEKKLRQIEILKERAERKEDLLPEQIAKMDSEEDLIKELASLSLE